MDSIGQAPLAPMLARLAAELPEGGFFYEPKWDGLRCVAARVGSEIELWSRNRRPLARYFPEVVAALRELAHERIVLDGEIILATRTLDFAPLLERLHPTPSRVERLSRETPAALVAFDLLAIDGEDLRSFGFEERRRRLELALGARRGPLWVTPITTDRAAANRWLDRFCGGGIDGVVAKHRNMPYEPGKRTMIKVKRYRTVDCVLGGMRVYGDGSSLVASLLLGLFDEQHALRHVGVASAFTDARRRALFEELSPLTMPLEGHPWERGFGIGRSPLGRLKGAAGRWMPSMSLDWIPLRPERVCEVACDQVDDGRFRHGARFLRWRPDKDAASCTMAQLAPARVDVTEVLAS